MKHIVPYYHVEKFLGEGRRIFCEGVEDKPKNRRSFILLQSETNARNLTSHQSLIHKNDFTNFGPRATVKGPIKPKTHTQHKRKKSWQHVFYFIRRWQRIPPGVPIDAPVVEIPPLDPMFATATEDDDGDCQGKIQHLFSIASCFKNEDLQQQKVF